ALGLGISNGGDVFESVAAFSPGFIPPGFERTANKPRIFISHGTSDQILPFEECGKPVASALKRGGYAVTFRQFDGPHTVPREVTEEAFRWFLNPEAAKASAA